MELPHTIILHLHEPDEDDDVVVVGRILYAERTYDVDLGAIKRTDDSTWEAVFGDGCRREGTVERYHDAGPAEVIGILLDILLDDAIDNPEIDEFVESEDDDDDDDDDDDMARFDKTAGPPAEDDEAEGDEPRHIEGRKWYLVSRTEDSITKAMQVGDGVLVRIETFGDDDGDYAMSSTFLPGMTLQTVLTEMADWEQP